MGSIGGMLGLSGGAGGSGFAAPAKANVVAPVTADQATGAYNTAQGTLQQQQNFANALAGQNGIGNQSSVFNQLQGVANGTGPNPAQAQLAQATGQNVANQAALMAGQRGSNANAGLIARQAAMQGANTQQQSIGQTANLQAQQSLNALSGLGNLATQQVGQQQQAISGLNQTAQGEQGQLLNSIAQANNANVDMQSNVNSANAGLANTTMQGQQALIGGAANGLGAGIFAEGGKVPKPMYYSGTPSEGVSSIPQVGVYADPNTDPNNPYNPPAVQVQAPAAAVPAQQAAASKANTASAPKPSSNAQPSSPSKPVAQPNYGNPGANALYQGVSSFGKFLSGAFSGSSNDGSDNDTQQAYLNANSAVGTADPNNIMKGDAGFNKEEDMSAANEPSDFNAAEGGKVPAMVSPGERYLPPKEVQEVKAGKKNPMEAGEEIPGKPAVGGAKNSYANDTVPKTLEEGGLVLPRSVTQAKHPHWEAMKFVQAHMAKGGMVPSKPKAKK